MTAAGSDGPDIFLGGAPAPKLPDAHSSGPTDEVTWGLRQIIYGILLALAGLVVSIATIALPVAAAFGADSVEADAANALSQVGLDLLAVAGVVLLIRRSGSTIYALGLRPPQKPADGRDRGGSSTGYPWGYHLGLVALGLLMSYVCLLSYLAIVSLLGLHFLEPDQQIPKDYLRNDVVTAILGVGVVAVAPVCEELFFRGFVFGGLRRMWGFLPGAIVSGFLFSSAHVEPGLIIPFAGIGIVFAFLYDRSRSIFVSMTVHACFNLISFVLLVAQARNDNAAVAMFALRHLGI